ncbi:endonuclease domain-containing protein [Microbacterium sp. zg.Y625]|uniref:endonuclease domain-containing protein n=1 Tax=Microbacterium jiangjiandongii TaxID=3049071 RepID=UPI00214B3AFE|nr:MULTISPECIES: endonuclease domain-containing protein [unclassified Microbacterium]MCR2792536.1 endonuclease domain-containing protein [Microbacterium sp. zg.Y625]WIM26527.1 endonuclease domain-containing protein [Microbacterium sp. zg-Y625]
MAAEMRTETAIRRLCERIAVRGGVARVSSLQREGWTRYCIRMALERGLLSRVRRDWVAIPGADAELVAAARGGVVLSCITEARRRGLWVLREERPHVAALPHAAGHKASRPVVHWAEPLVPRHPDVLADPIENVLTIVASCQPHEVALAVWESALQQGLATMDVLARMPLPAASRRLLAEAHPFAGSGLETIFAVRLRWLRVRIVPQAWIEGHRVDFLIGDRLVIQIDGGEHVGRQRADDVAHDAELLLRGYHVIRVTYPQVIDDWPAVQDRIARAVGQGLHRVR